LPFGHVKHKENIMETLGINLGLLITQLVSFLIIGGYPILSLVALFVLRRNRLTGTNQAIWALLIIAVPFLGALAFFIVKPTEDTQS
jgi:hypothetical protein